MRRSLSCYLPTHCCLFGDILDVFEDSQKVSATILACETFEQKVYVANQAKRQTHAFCHRHERLCPFNQGAQIRVQGPPCPDFSTAGKRAGLQGPRMPAVLAAGAKTGIAQPALTIVENVPAFPLQLACAAYGEDYTWTETLQDPGMVGFEFMARSRSAKFRAKHSLSHIVCSTMPLRRPARKFLARRAAPSATRHSSGAYWT